VGVKLVRWLLPDPTIGSQRDRAAAGGKEARGLQGLRIFDDRVELAVRHRRALADHQHRGRRNAEVAANFDGLGAVNRDVLAPPTANARNCRNEPSSARVSAIFMRHRRSLFSACGRPILSTASIH